MARVVYLVWYIPDFGPNGTGIPDFGICPKYNTIKCCGLIRVEPPATDDRNIQVSGLRQAPTPVTADNGTGPQSAGSWTSTAVVLACGSVVLWAIGFCQGRGTTAHLVASTIDIDTGLELGNFDVDAWDLVVSEWNLLAALGTGDSASQTQQENTCTTRSYIYANAFYNGTAVNTT